MDEDADDAGGVRKEFFLLLLKEILDPKYGMFDFHADTAVIWFRSNSFEVCKHVIEYLDFIMVF